MKSNANEDFYNKGKILMRRTGSTIIVDIDLSKSMALKNLYLIIPKNENENDIYCIAAQLNSTLFDYYHKSKTSGENKAFAQFTGEYIEKFPCLIDKTDEFKLLIEEIYTNKADLQKQTTRFLRLLQSSFSNLTINKKIENWYDLTFGEFRKELEKQKIAIAIKELMDYQELFDTNKDTIQALKTKINQTEREIDKLVYQLYKLTPEEIQTIENN